MRVDPTKRCPDTSAVRTVGGRLHCAHCESDVLDLRHVTERRALAMVAAERARAGRVCVSVFTDAEGRARFLVPSEPCRRLPVLPLAFVATVATACGVREPGAVATTPPPPRAQARASVAHSEAEKPTGIRDQASLDAGVQGAEVEACRAQIDASTAQRDAGTTGPKPRNPRRLLPDEHIFHGTLYE